MDTFQISEAILEHTVILNDIDNICEVGGLDEACNAILAMHNQEIKSLHRLIATMSGDTSDANMVYNGWLSPKDADTVTAILNSEKRSDPVFAKKIEADAKRSQEMMLQAMEREEDRKAKARDEVAALRDRIAVLEKTLLSYAKAQIALA